MKTFIFEETKNSAIIDHKNNIERIRRIRGLSKKDVNESRKVVFRPILLCDKVIFFNSHFWSD